MLELKEWVNNLFERIPAGTHRGVSGKNTGDGGVDDQQQSRLLAAGILVKLEEVIKRYQGRLIGVNVDFTY